VKIIPVQSETHLAYVQGQRVRRQGQMIFKTKFRMTGATSGGLAAMLSNCHFFSSFKGFLIYLKLYRHLYSLKKTHKLMLNLNL